MNKVYNIIWNAALGLWVVASELSKGKKKAARAKPYCLSPLVYSPAFLSPPSPCRSRPRAHMLSPRIIRTESPLASIRTSTTTVFYMKTLLLAAN
ncbi:ESPR domain-containing protein [Citrobacter amalonaticus]|nr:ESPR domain-containing protein [Citrobacter amalonaticus]